MTRSKRGSARKNGGVHSGDLPHSDGFTAPFSVESAIGDAWTCPIDGSESLGPVVDMEIKHTATDPIEEEAGSSITKLCEKEIVEGLEELQLNEESSALHQDRGVSVIADSPSEGESDEEVFDYDSDDSYDPKSRQISTSTVVETDFVKVYFSEHEAFSYDPCKATLAQFHALAELMAWDEDTKGEERHKLRDFLVMQFNSVFGTDASYLAGWQELCKAIDPTADFDDVLLCKEMLICYQSELSLISLVDNASEVRYGKEPQQSVMPEDAILVDIRLTLGHDMAGMLLQELSLLTIEDTEPTPVPGNDNVDEIAIAEWTKDADADDGWPSYDPGTHEADRIPCWIESEEIRKAQSDESKHQHDHIASFFQRFSHFTFDNSEPVKSRFDRLTEASKWSPNRQKREYNKLRRAIVAQFDILYGDDSTSLAAWQKLCKACDISPPPLTIARCRQAIQDIHVVYWDLVEAPLAGIPVPRYASVTEMNKMLDLQGKVIPHHFVPHGTLLASLMKKSS